MGPRASIPPRRQPRTLLVLLLLLTGQGGSNVQGAPEDAQQEGNDTAGTADSQAALVELAKGKLEYSSITTHDNGEQPNEEYLSSLRYYHELSSVMLVNRTIHVYLPPSATEEQMQGFIAPLTIFRGKEIPDLQVLMHRREEGSPDPLEACGKYVAHPAMFYGSPFIGNTHNYLLDAWAPVFSTLDHFGLLQNFPIMTESSRLDVCDFQQRLGQNQAALLTWKHADHVRWGFSMEMLARRRFYIDDAFPLCFDRLIVGRALQLDYAFNHTDTGERAKQLRRLSWFLRHAAALQYLRLEQQRGEGRLKPEAVRCDAPLPTLENPNGLPVVTFLARGRKNMRRTVLNRDDVLQFIRENYDVQLEVPTFERQEPWVTADLMHRTAVAVGMHGAGFTNTMWMRPGSAALQMLPFGWDSQKGQELARPLKALISDVGAHYFEWVNPFSRNGYRWPVPKGEPSETLEAFEHPSNASEFHEAFWHQQTYVDMDSFTPVLVAAMAAAGVRPRAGAAAQALLPADLKSSATAGGKLGENPSAGSGEAGGKVQPAKKGDKVEYSSIRRLDNGFLDRPKYLTSVRYYYEATRVRLRSHTVHVYLSPDDDTNLTSTLKPLTYFRGKAVPDLQIEIERWDGSGPNPFAGCDQWFHDPAMFYGNPYGNTWHYLLDGWGAVFPTLHEFGLLKNYEEPEVDYIQLDVCGFQERRKRNAAVLLTWNGTEHPHWWFTMQMLAKQRHIINDQHTLCFDRLIIGKRLQLDYFFGHLEPVERSQHLRRAAWFTRHATALEYLREQLPEGSSWEDVDCRAPLPTLPTEAGLPVVTFLARGDKNAKRTILNRDEILQYIQANYKVQLELPHFQDLDNWATTDVMHKTDCVIGVHGAGWTNTIWLRPNTSALQMLPYGWDRGLGQAYFSRQLLDAGVHYFEWLNTDPNKAFLWLGDKLPKNATGPSFGTFELPERSKEAFHILKTQQTLVDMEEFTPVLDKTLAAAGIQKRTSKTL